MADTITLKRIVDLVSQTDLDDGVYTVIDSVTGAVKKFPLGSMICSIAPMFSDVAEYEAGDFVNYGGQIYRFTEAHSIEEWIGTDAEAVTLTDVLATKTEMNQKVDPDGTYENLTAGTAEQLLSDTGIEDSTPYTLRRSKAGSREYDELVGGSIVYNQGLDNENANAWKTDRATGSLSDGVFTVTATAQNGGAFFIYNRKQGHIYYHSVDVKLTTAGTYAQLNHYGGNPRVLTASTTHWQKLECIYEFPSGNTVDTRLSFADTRSSDWDAIQLKNFMSVDLTQMFGSAVAQHMADVWTQDAQAGCELFREMMGDGYLPYNSTGELMSVSGVSAHVMTGFNQWDEQWQVGGLAWATGAEITSTSSRRTDFIPVWEGESYYLKAPYGSGCVWYDAGKERVGSKTSGLNGGIVVAPTNASYIRIVFGSVGTEYGHDICFNVSDPKRNGTYEPYTEYRYPLDSSLTLKGVPKVVDGKICYDGDIYSADGTVTRKYGDVDLGTLSWTYNSTYSMFYAKITDGKKPSPSAAGTGIGFCTKYKIVQASYNNVGEGEMLVNSWMGGATNYSVVVRDSNYTDAATFKTAVSGVMLVYEIDTVVESATPYQHLQIVDAGGTEEYVTTGLVPVGHNTKYPTDIVKKIDGLPSDFSTLIGPTEATMVATRNYNTGEFLICNNILYKATASIATGASIVDGTNVVSTTIAEQLITLFNS